MRNLSQEQINAKLAKAVSLLAECSASVNLDSAMDMIAGGENITRANFGSYGTVPDTIWAHMDNWEIADRVSKEAQELQNNVDPRSFMKDNEGVKTPRDMQAEQAESVVGLIKDIVKNGTGARLTCPTGIGRTMILTMACNVLVKEGINVVYASSHRVMVEQMKEFGPDFHTMTFQEFTSRDVEEVPCELVIYDHHVDVDFGDDIVGIRMF